jgi:hypothetical protein
MTVSELPFHKLHIGNVDPMVAASRQGFDDGYFLKEKASLGDEKLQLSYDHEYNLGRVQRDRIDRSAARKEAARKEAGGKK